MNTQADDSPARSAIAQGILETVIYADDLDAALLFYRDLIGLPLVSKEPNRHLFFRVGSSMLLVFNPHSTRKKRIHIGDQVIPQHGAGEATHFAFQIERAALSTIKSRLLEHGVAVEAEIDWPHGGQSIYCRDPVGNSVEFATRDLWFS